MPMKVKLQYIHELIYLQNVTHFNFLSFQNVDGF